MTIVRVEWINLSVGPLYDGGAANVIREVVGAATALAVTGTATDAGSRPEAPAGARYARVTALDGNAIVAAGADPTADQTNGLVVASGAVELVPVASGDKLSFVEIA